MERRDVSKRTFLKTNAKAVAGWSVFNLLAGTAPAASGGDRAVRIGFVGTGGRGRGLMNNILSIEGVEIPAVCDTDARALTAAREIVTRHGQASPEGYAGPEDYQRLMDREDLDAVIIATPWDLHTPMAVYGMKAGKAVGCEVPIAYTLDECWELIRTHEETGVPCMQLENWSFRSDNLAVLNMIREGFFGEITHAHCAYSHDCIDHWYFDRKTGEQRWGAKYLLEHNRCQYPTHQQGPVLSWMNIHAGDAYKTLTSTATDCFSIYDYFQRRFPGHPNGKLTYRQGDVVTTTVRTHGGKTLVINFDMQSPRPYDNRWTVQGTRGIYNEQRDALYLTGKSPRYHAWEPFPPYHDKHQHRWTQHASGGHGGADGIMLNQFVAAVRDGGPMPLSLYDGVLMASVGPLSEMSLAADGKTVTVPDFTRGAWKTSRPYFGV